MIRILGIGLVAYLLFLWQRSYYKEYWNDRLSVTLSFVQEHIFEGETGELLEIVENKKRLPLPALKVKFQTSRNLVFEDMGGSRATDHFYRNDVFQVSGGEKITRTLTFRGKKRGYYKIIGIDLVGADLFLTVEMIESYTADDCYLYVYPRPFDSREFQLTLRQLNGELLTRRHLMEDPFEYRGVREYQPYDDMKSINWKATAKTQGLKVNQKNYTTLRTVRLFLNLEDRRVYKEDEEAEASLQIATGIARFFLTQGIKTALYANGKDMIDQRPVKIEASAGAGQMERILRALARVDLTAGTADFGEVFGEELLTSGMGAQTIIISPTAYQEFLVLLSRYQASGQDYTWIYPMKGEAKPDLPGWTQKYVKYLSIDRMP